MPKSKTVETVGKSPDTCILKMGKSNDVIQWREKMYNLATEEYGEVGTYFYTNTAFRYPFPHERDYNLFYIEPEPSEAPIEDDEGEDEEDNVEEDIGELVEPEEVPVPVLAEATRLALINKLREGAYEGRRKKQEAALLGLRKMWAKTWVRMSPQSQSKVREEPGFDWACL
jgi:hypothetical protein